MKRSRARADPVSCQTCRSKKLKCNRVQPCSNCVARSLTCHFVVPPQRRNEALPASPNNAEILGRIEQLEATLLRSNAIPAQPVYATQVTQHAKRQKSSISSEGTSVAHEEWDGDEQTRLLEYMEKGEGSPLVRLSGGLSFVISLSPTMEYGRWSDTIVTFPTYETAILLFHNFEANIHHMCPIFHISTTKSLLKSVYLQVARGETFPAGQAALLFSIFAVSAFFHNSLGSFEAAATELDAIQLSRTFCKSGLDVLNHSQRNTSGSLEDIQASILLSLTLSQLDGLSARSRYLFQTALTIARELRLHQLDAKSDVDTEESVGIPILMNREIKRRVFWYIAAKDWLLSTVSGPQEGTYSVQPNQVKVNLPKACRNEDMFLGEDETLMPSRQPNSMTFFREFIRLAHLCREMTDNVPLETSKLKQLPYECIISLDHKLLDYLSSLPSYFKLDAENYQKSKLLEAVHLEIPFWRYFLATAAYSRRCKLHQRFLLRQNQDSRYAYSRKACLESARKVIRVYENVSATRTPTTLVAHKGMTVHFTHLALAIMIMDLCFNRNEADEAEIKEEVKVAFKILETSKEIYPLFARSLNSLKSILQEHNVFLADEPMPTSTSSSDFVGVNAINDADTQSTLPGLEATINISDNFDDFWQAAFQNEPNFDSIAWDNLFAALDSRPI